MKKIFSLILLCLFVQSVWSQSGEGYDPENPGDPDVFYTLTLEAAPLSGGTVSPNSRQKLSVGQSVYVNASPRLGYEFKRWMAGDSLVSTNSSFSFTMPKKDVVLTAYFEWNPEYNPQNPGDPDAEGYSHKVYVYASPSAGGYFNSSSFTLVEGKTTNIYAYPREGYRFESWMCNGKVVSTENPLNIRMGTSDIAYTATFVYNPVSPGEPSPNVFNAATGELIIDNFTPGSLNSAIYATVTQENYDAVKSITIIGRMASSDFGFARNFRQCQSIDFSRTTGYKEVPSHSFEAASALEQLFLPMNIESIGENAFNGCTHLKDIYLYATTPPLLAENSLSGLDKSVKVHVPSAAIALYAATAGWNKLTIQSLDENEKSIIVNLPGENGTYKNMTIELQNILSGQIYRCLVTDRTSYTFYGLMKNTSYNVYLKTAAGIVLGEINGVTLADKDLNISFTDIKSMQNVTLSVKTPDGCDVTSDVTVTWLDEQGQYLRQGNKVTDLLTGTNIRYRLKLSKDLAMQYVQPSDFEYKVKENNNEIICTLSAIRQITLNGCIKDVATKQGIYGATVSISQMLNGKYSKTIIAKTDNKGNYTATAYNAPTSLAISAYDYVNQTTEVTIDPSAENVTVDDIAMASIIGATINISLTYTPSVAEGETAETQNWYDDYQNVAYSIYNLTTEKEVTQISVRYPQLVILDGANMGDSLVIKAVSKKNAFKEVPIGVKVNTASPIDIVFPIKEFGGINSQYKNNENAEVVGMLYDGSGYLKKVYDYASDARLSISGLTDGNYTLVTMGKSSAYNSIYSLTRLKGILLENVDYQQSQFSVESGLICTGICEQVPYFDENKFKYIDKDQSYFNVDNTSIVAGNYLTFMGHLETKDVDLTSLKNIKYIVDLPPSAVFVENSVMIGGNIVNDYALEGNTLTIPCSQIPKEKVKFCVIPTESGTFLPSATVAFTVGEKEAMLSIGCSPYEVKKVSISVPSLTASTNIKVSGTAAEGGTVEIYDNDILIGQTTSLANGTWSTEIELYKSYSHSIHDIYAKIKKDNGMEFTSEVKQVEYDKNSNVPEKVIMTFYNGWYKADKTVVFNLLNGTTTPSSYPFYSGTDFTFLAEFTHNDSTQIKNVNIKVLNSDGSVRTLPTVFDGKQNKWVATTKYETANKLPQNVKVEYLYIPQKVTIDSLQILDDNNQFNELIKKYVLNIDTTNVEILEANDSKLVSKYQTYTMDVPVFIRMEKLEYEDWIGELEKLSYNTFDINGISTCVYDSTINETHHVEWIWIKEEKKLLQMEFANKNEFLPISLKSDSQIHTIKRAPAIFGNIAQIFGNSLLNIFCNAGDIRNIINEYNTGYNELQDWLRKYNKTQDDHFQLYNKAKQLLEAKCPDGSLRLYYQAYDWYSMYLDFYFNDANMMREQFKRKLDRMEKDLVRRRNDAVGLSATLGIFHVAADLLSGGSATLGEFTINFFKDTGTDKISEDLINGLFKIDYYTSEDLSEWYYPESCKIIKDYSDLMTNIRKDYKLCKEDDDKNDDDDDFEGEKSTPIIDPSGYVYEGVSSNRLQGVTATAYYMETTEDMYGVLHDEPKVWDAEEYEQENPLFTDENGMYQWFVPQGLWQVKFEKEGYETTYSEWLPVPPPQLEVNIGMVQSRQPEVKQAHAYKDGIEVEFDKYMQPTLLNTGNILVSQNGEYVEGEVKLLNEETAYADENVKYASKVRFVPTTPFTASEVILTVANRVKSYAGLQMQDTYQQTLDLELELTSIKADSVADVTYESSQTLIVEVFPASASAGKMLHVKSSSPMIASVEKEEYLLDKDGRAAFVVNGELPGSASLNYSIDGYDLTASTIVHVNMLSANTCAKPIASIASGSCVEAGTSVSLSCATEGATIYYTLDGSCPCDEQTRKLYDGTPIVINEDVTIKAMAIAPDMYDSEIAVFVYTVKKHEIIEREVTLSSAGYATFYDGQAAYTLPQGLSACVVTAANDKRLTYQTIAEGSQSGIVPKGVAVMLKGDELKAGTYTLTSTEEAKVYNGLNLLRGSDKATMTYAENASYFYKLSYGPSGTALNKTFGWYWGEANGGAFMMDAHKAWLAIPKSQSVKRFLYEIEESIIIPVNAGDSEQNNVFYDLQGRRITKPLQRGIYIHNGQKTIIR